MTVAMRNVLIPRSAGTIECVGDFDLCLHAGSLAHGGDLDIVDEGIEQVELGF